MVTMNCFFCGFLLVPHYLVILSLVQFSSPELRIAAFSTSSSQASPTITTRAITTTTATPSLPTAHTDNEIITDRCWEEELLELAQPLVPAPPSLHASFEILQRDGVVRLNREAFSIEATRCDRLRDRILSEIERPSNNDHHTVGDQTTSEDQKKDRVTYIPGTRLRPDTGAVDLTFGGGAARHDLLLPLRDATFPHVRPVLESAAGQLESLLLRATDQLLPRLHGSAARERSWSSNDHAHNDPYATRAAAELVEVGSLVVRRGSFHQSLHGDYRRYDDTDDPQNGSQEEPWTMTQAREGKLPPRIVTFVALQDIPSDQHGPTGFITGTHTAHAHGLLHRDDSTTTTLHAKTDGDMAQSRQRILDSSSSGVRTTSGVRQGDLVMYDASVLHWGGANSIPNYDRAMFYFGVSQLGAAARLEVVPELPGFDIVPPILLQDITGLSQPQH